MADDQETTEDQSTAVAESDQQTSQNEAVEDTARQTPDTQPTGETSAKTADPDCAGWFSEAESISQRASEFFVQNELTGNRGVVEKIDVRGRDNPEGYTCVVHFSDKTTDIEVVVHPDEIIVREARPDISDRWTCWYDYKCPPPNNDLVLSKRKCSMMPPIFVEPARIILLANTGASV